MQRPQIIKEPEFKAAGNGGSWNAGWNCVDVNLQRLYGKDVNYEKEIYIATLSCVIYADSLQQFNW